MGDHTADSRVNVRPHRWHLWVLLAIVLARGTLYSLIVPLWQAPDEPGHFEYIRLMARLGRPPTRADLDPALERAIIQALDAANFWTYTRQTRPTPLPETFDANPFLRRSGRQIGDEPPLYYIVPALLTRITPEITAQARLARAWSTILLALTVAAAWWASQRLWPNQRWLALGVPAFFALAPMPTFIGMSINNDVLAMATATGSYGALIVLAQRRADARSIVLMAVSVAISLASKRTTLFLLPTALIAIPICRPRRPLSRRARRILWAVGGFSVSIVLIALLWRGEAADAWRIVRSDGPIRPAPRGQPAYEGRYALLVMDPSDAYRVEVSQPVPDAPIEAWGGRTARLRVWLRASDGPTLACVRIADGQTDSVRCVLADERWQAVEVEHRIHPQARHLRGAVGIGWPNDPSGRGTVLVDQVSFQLADEPGVEWLRNGGAEQGRRVLQPALDALTRLMKPPTGWPRKLMDPATYNLTALRRYGLYTALLFPGFWGNFGWLQLPLALPWYILLAIVCGVALAGLIRFWRSIRRGNWSPALDEAQQRALTVMALSVALALAQTLLPMLGRDWQPQGRYLFPALFPIATGLLLGTGAWLPTSRRKWVVYGWIIGLILLDVVSLVKTIWPAYNSAT